MVIRLLGTLILLVTTLYTAGTGFIPPNGVPDGWSQKGETREFLGSALYRHINGGAELYHQYGFETLLVQDYQKDDTEVRVEIYRFKESDQASALFTEINSGLALESGFGSACVLDDYQYMFQFGPYIVTVTRFEKSEASKSALESLTIWIDQHIRQ